MTAEPGKAAVDAGAHAGGWTATRLILALLTLGALALRLLDLDRFEFFIDEAATWWYARLIAEGPGLEGILEGIRLEPTPPLYYALVAATGAVLGWGDAALRLPSVLFGTLSVPAVYVLVRRLVGPEQDLARPAGLFAAGLLVVHPLHVSYSREARVYPLLLLLTLLAWWAIRRALDYETRDHEARDHETRDHETRDRETRDAEDATRHGPPAWTLWAPVTGLLIVASYCHYYGLFLLATAGALVLLGGRTFAARRRGLAAVGLAALVFLPYVLHTLPSLRQSDAAWSVEVLYQLFPGDRSFLRVLEMESVGALYPPYLRQLSQPPTASFVRWPALLAQAGLGLLGLVVLVRRVPRRAGFLVVAWLLPVLLPWAVTHTVRPIFHPGRHDVYALWGVVAVAGLGLARLAGSPRRRRAGVVVAVLCLLPVVFAAGLRLAALHHLPAPQDARRAGAFLAEHVRSGDRIVTLANRRLKAERYLRLALADGQRTDLPLRSFPAELDAHPGWADPRDLNARLGELRREARERVRRFGEEGVRRVFVLPSNPRPVPGERPPALAPVDAAFFEALADAGWRPLPALTDRDLVIYAFSRPEPGTS